MSLPTRVRGRVKMRRRLSLLWPAALLALPVPAHAQSIHPIWVVGALSPLVILMFAAFLGWLARSVRLGAIHAGLVILWAVCFWLASSFVTNDYIIWAPLAAYLLQAGVIVVSVLWYAIARMRSR